MHECQWNWIVIDYLQQLLTEKGGEQYHNFCYEEDMKASVHEQNYIEFETAKEQSRKEHESINRWRITDILISITFFFFENIGRCCQVGFVI